jgi:hypothetical protein
VLNRGARMKKIAPPCGWQRDAWNPVTFRRSSPSSTWQMLRGNGTMRQIECRFFPDPMISQSGPTEFLRCVKFFKEADPASQDQERGNG